MNESQNERVVELPDRPRVRAVWRTLPHPMIVMVALMVVAGFVTGAMWPSRLALASLVYALIRLRGSDRWDPPCDGTAHWDEPCPVCDASLARLWKGGHR
ncbi:hypothetical protein [Actinomadura xylanilytica]|uniref:hypothetical protein n=1 Tax=Actinomadura xylanilytica TaxID=887459 RepID=UPI00255AD13A|nr:hypothetical protein [Actinomadura xylanilytica]MDL4777868.1 hypothetical protein [Actinomadura xylanilytica]